MTDLVRVFGGLGGGDWLGVAVMEQSTVLVAERGMEWRVGHARGIGDAGEVVFRSGEYPGWNQNRPEWQVF